MTANVNIQKSLKENPRSARPEQIKECHGDSEEHPCEDEKSNGGVNEMNILEVDRLTKKYGDLTAPDGISLPTPMF